MAAYRPNSANTEVRPDDVRRMLFFESDDSGDEVDELDSPCPASTVTGDGDRSTTSSPSANQGPDSSPFKSSDSTIRLGPKLSRPQRPRGLRQGVEDAANTTVLVRTRSTTVISWWPVTVLLTAFVLMLATFLYSTEIVNPELQWHTHRGELYLHFHGNQWVYITGFVTSVLVAVAIGTGCGCVSVTMTYFDSEDPGRVPPTPLSPSKYRQRAGHTFHSSYIMCFLNSMMASLYALWWQRRSFISM